MRDLGRFTLELAPFDWDSAAQKVVPVAASSLPNLSWELHSPDPGNPDEPGPPFIEDYVVHGAVTIGATRLEHAEAHGGAAFLVITNRGRAGETCAPSIVPLRQLPGYAQRSKEVTLHITVPTCRVTHVDTIEIPSGPFYYAGLGEPASKWVRDEHGPPEVQIDLPAFRIDRNEVTNAAYGAFARMSDLTGIPLPHYVTNTPQLQRLGDPRSPVSGVTWTEANSYCRFLGKSLPTKQQWLKAMRGGITLADGSLNPEPRRNLPWGQPQTPVPANIRDSSPPGIQSVEAFPGDVSPYGVRGLAGNVMEWTLSLNPEQTVGYRIARGGEFEHSTADDLLDYVAIENDRPIFTRSFSLGMRCATN
jgi:formylglycine-generating enzyme required for sulfatase activity